MKHTFVLFIVLSRFLACSNVVDNAGAAGSDSVQTASGSPAPDDTAFFARDVSITAANAYSNLFLDSATVADFVAREGWSDAETETLRRFYNRRNYQYAWFSGNGLTEEARAFWNIQNNESETTAGKTLRSTMDTLVERDTLRIFPADTAFVATELRLTHRLLRLAQQRNNDSLNAAALWHMVPVKKHDPLQLADSILNKQNDSSYFMQSQTAYGLLKEQLRKYYTVSQSGGWQPLPKTGKKWKKGNASPAITAVKKRLQLTGDFTGADTTKTFTDSLDAAIRSFQQRNGFEPTGIITDSLISVMNVPATKRIEQLLINLNRMAWAVPAASGNRIDVNVPSFMLSVYEGAQKAFDMDVVVGKEGTTVLPFRGELNQIVFAPYWNIPASIVKNEILPAMDKDKNYLAKKNMEIVKKGDSLPVIRQLPGPDNALGNVKFLFPNRYDIYLHDTPKKEAFAKQNRALSHGCIRLADAEKMAQYLLRNDKTWTAEKIRAAMASGKEQYVKITQPVPVAISYYTAWVDEAGGLNFRNDVYRRDSRTAEMLFISGR